MNDQIRFIATPTDQQENGMNILELKTSIHSNGGQSSILADAFVGRLAGSTPSVKVVVRDLAQQPVPHLDAARFGAFITPEDKRDASQKQQVALSDALIAELRAADVIVIGLPMYNFGIPSTLKAYFDHIARAGQTFRYTEKGPVGLLTGKRAVVFATRGGLYVGTPLDSQTSYIRAFLAFVGITDVEFVYAEGLAMGDASKQVSLAKARIASDLIAAEAGQLATEPALALAA
jgi:FMN-dependent NADH-azoreductase